MINPVYLIIILIVAIIAAAGAFLIPSSIQLKMLSADSLLQIVMPILFVSLIIERLIAYLMVAWRTENSQIIGLEISELTNRIKLGERDSDLDEQLAKRKKTLVSYDNETIKLKNAFGLLAGIMISAVGFRAIEPLVEPGGLEDLSNLHLLIFHAVDIVLTGITISGGTNFIDSMTSKFTSPTS